MTLADKKNTVTGTFLNLSLTSTIGVVSHINSKTRLRKETHRFKPCLRDIRELTLKQSWGAPAIFADATCFVMPSRHETGVLSFMKPQGQV
jgi:hypothetical protein